MRGRGTATILRVTGALLVSLVVLLPIYAALTGSLTASDNLGEARLFPEDWAWRNFLEVWERLPLGQHLLTSAIYGIGAAAICGIFGSVTGYALSRFSFPGKRPFLYLLLVCQVIPLIVIILPLFRLVQMLGLYDSYVSIIIPLGGLGLPISVMLMKSYFDGIPTDIEDAAFVDGCTHWQALVRVVAPMAMAGVFTTMALIFFQAWQTFSLPLILSNSVDKTPVTVGIFRLLSDAFQPWHLIMAASLFAVIPPVIVYFIAQRFLVKGVTLGAVK